MIRQLETHYLEQQLRKAEYERQSMQWGLALVHYQRAYREACWLCDHFIKAECATYTEQSFNYLKNAAEGCINCSDALSMRCNIEADRDIYQNKIRSTFGTKFSRSLFK